MGCMWFQSYSALYSKFQVSQSYSVKPSLQGQKEVRLRGWREDGLAAQSVTGHAEDPGHSSQVIHNYLQG